MHPTAFVDQVLAGPIQRSLRSYLRVGLLDTGRVLWWWFWFDLVHICPSLIGRRVGRRLKHLGISTLKYWRHRGDIIKSYIIVHGR